MYACPDFIDTQTKKQKTYFRKGVKQNEEILKTISIMRSSSSSYSCVATSAMAAGGISATYTAAGENETTAKLTIDASGYTADQKTLLIVPSSVSLDKVTAGDVVQIDQNAEIVDVVLRQILKTVHTQFTWVATVRFTAIHLELAQVKSLSVMQTKTDLLMVVTQQQF